MKNKTTKAWAIIEETEKGDNIYIVFGQFEIYNTKKLAKTKGEKIAKVEIKILK